MQRYIVQDEVTARVVVDVGSGNAVQVVDADLQWNPAAAAPAPAPAPADAHLQWNPAVVAAAPADTLEAAPGPAPTAAASGEFRLTGIRFAVPTGSITAVVGRVGCGKTTLLTAVIGELDPTRGVVQAAETIGCVSDT